MSDKILSTLLTAAVLAALAVWVPLLETFAWLSRRREAATCPDDRRIGGQETESVARTRQQRIPA